MRQDELQASFRALDRSFMKIGVSIVLSAYEILECLSGFQLLQLVTMCGFRGCGCVRAFFSCWCVCVCEWVWVLVGVRDACVPATCSNVPTLGLRKTRNHRSTGCEQP